MRPEPGPQTNPLPDYWLGCQTRLMPCTLPLSSVCGLRVARRLLVIDEKVSAEQSTHHFVVFPLRSLPALAVAGSIWVLIRVTDCFPKALPELVEGLHLRFV